MSAAAQPSGTVTMVFTDIEGSTRLLDELGVDAYREALAEHRRIVRDACARYEGYEVDYEGDAFFYAFTTAQAAVDAVSEAMAALDGGPIRIRVGIHTGEPALDPPKYVGMDVHRAARIMSAAHGGQVVLSPSTVALLDPGSVQLKDLGQHRLKDLSSPTPLHQLQLDAVPAEFPPLKTLYRTNLPVPATPFRGRGRELAEVVALVKRDDVRLVTLSGPGGTGKTRLALQAAAEASDHHPDGIVWVPLASVRDPSRVLVELADALGVKAEPGLTLAETLAAGLAGRRPLLVVDNAEHLLPELAGALAEFRAAVPTATLLVTSRERLQLEGEQVYAVPSLDEREGVDLFLERARSLGVVLDQTAAVAQLCARLDQLPLALELAAARTPLFAPAQLLERLDQRLDLFTGGRDSDPRQLTLRATIAWSHDLLDEPEQRLFRRLAAFVGGCSYEAAEQVADATPDTLQSLLDKSLLRRSEATDAPRYWMLETIREYATGQLARAGELDELGGRHADFYSGVVRDAREKLMGPEQRARLAILDREAANWRAALRRELEIAGTDRAARMAADLARYWWFRGQADEGLPLLEALLDRETGDLRLRARMLGGAADLASQLDERQTEQRCLEEALQLFDELGDLDGVTQTCGSSVWWASRQGDVATASLFADRALASAERIDTPWLRCYAWTSASEAAGARGDWSHAKRLAGEGIRFARESGDPRSMVMALGNLGWCEIASENYERARALLAEAVVAGDPDDREFVSVMESNLGLTESLLGRPAIAADHFGRSLRAAAPGSRLAVAEPMFGVAGVVAATRPEVGVRLWAASAALHTSCGAPLGPVLERIERTMLAPIRSELPAVEFDRLWEAGQALTMPAAVDLAIEEAEHLAMSTAPP